MRREYLKLNILCLTLLALLAAVTIRAQEPVGSEEQKQVSGQAGTPMEIFRQLNLSVGQMQQIRRINQERRPLFMETQMQLREANRKLDLAIYADTASEDEIKSLMKEAQLAQAEVIKVRTLTEYQIRKVLTPEQLGKFREIREQFAQRMNRRRQNAPRGDLKPPDEPGPKQFRPEQQKRP